jgi:hypothetical protein
MALLDSTNNQFQIVDKTVLTKTANSVYIDANQQVFSDIVSINARLSYIPTGSMPPAPMAGDVFYDNFNVTGSTLPGTGSLADKVVDFIFNAWDLKILK